MIPVPGQSEQGGADTPDDGDMLPGGGDPAAAGERPGSGPPDEGPAGTPGDQEGGLPQAGNDGWESSNEDPGDGRPAGGTRDAGAGGEDTGEPRGGRPGAAGEFEEAIGVLDGEILAERADVLARRNETAGQRGPTSLPDRDGGPRSESDQTPGVPGEPSPGVMPEGGSRPIPRPTPRAAPVPAAPVPPDVADARDDDVVCRQLREAAMAEADDALRAALWDEYRRCREG